MLSLIEQFQAKGINLVSCIALAKAGGKFKGRKGIYIPDFEEHYARYKAREVSKVQLAEELSFSRPTLDRLIRTREEKENCCVAVFFFMFCTKIFLQSFIEKSGVMVYNKMNGIIFFVQLCCTRNR